MWSKEFIEKAATEYADSAGRTDGIAWTLAYLSFKEGAEFIIRNIQKE